MLEIILLLTEAIATPLVTAGLALAGDLICAVGIAAVELLAWIGRRRAPATADSVRTQRWKNARRVAIRLLACGGIVAFAVTIGAITMDKKIAEFVIHRALNRFDNQFTLDPESTSIWQGRIVIANLRLRRTEAGDRQTDLSINRMTFDVSWRDLFAGHIVMPHVEVAGIEGAFAPEDSAWRTRTPWQFHVRELSVRNFDVSFHWSDRCPSGQKQISRLKIDKLETRSLDSRFWLMAFLLRSELHGSLDGKPIRIQHTPDVSHWELAALPTAILRGLGSNWLCRIPARGSVGVHCSVGLADNGDLEIDIHGSLDPFDGVPPTESLKDRLIREAAKRAGKLARPDFRLHFRIARARMRGVSSFSDDGFLRILIRQQDAESGIPQP